MCFRKLQYNLLQKHLLFETNMLQNNNITGFQEMYILYSLRFCTVSYYEHRAVCTTHQDHQIVLGYQNQEAKQ